MTKDIPSLFQTEYDIFSNIWSDKQTGYCPIEMLIQNITSNRLCTHFEKIHLNNDVVIEI